MSGCSQALILSMLSRGARRVFPPVGLLLPLLLGMISISAMSSWSPAGEMCVSGDFESRAEERSAAGCICTVDPLWNVPVLPSSALPRFHRSPVVISSGCLGLRRPAANYGRVCFQLLRQWSPVTLLFHCRRQKEQQM